MGVTVNQSLTIISKDASSNTAQVRYVVQCITSGESWNGYTQTGTFNIDGTNYYNDYTLPQNTTTTVFDKTVTINNASGKTVGASYSFPTTPYYGTQTGNTSVYIDLPLYLNITKFESTNIGANSVDINWATDVPRDWTQYQINDSNWIDSATYGETVASDSKSGTFNVGNLAPNTTYWIKMRCRRTSNQLWTESGTISVTTKGYATFTECRITSTTLNSINVKWNANKTVDKVQYKLNNGNWIDTAGLEFGIGNLSPNTNYTVKLRIRRQDSGLWTESSDMSATTKDIAKISSASNFNLGSSANVTITNPSGASVNLNVKIGNTSIKTQSLNTGSNTISFNDTQLDNMYKKFGSNNSVTITYVVTTNNNSNYTNTKTATCTLTGNQKTVRIGINNTTKRAKVFIGVNGQVKRAVVWIGVNGTPKRCI